MSDAPAPEAKPELDRYLGPPTNVRWWVFALACSASWLLYLQRYTFALIKPELVTEWGLKQTQLGMLDSAFATAYTGFQFPLGLLADAAGVQIVLSLLMMIGGIGLAMHAWAPSLNTLWLARGMLGLGQSAVFASLAKLTRSWFPLSIRTTVQGWVGVFFGRLGGMSSNLLFATVLLGMLGFDWRSAVYLFASLGILHGAVFFLFFRNSPRRHPLANEAEAVLVEEDKSSTKQAKKMPIRQMLRGASPRSLANLLALNAQTVLSTVADNIYSNWIPLFLFQVHQLQFKEMGIYSALPLLGGAFGGMAGGYLNDFLIRRSGNLRWSRSGVGLMGKGMAAALLLIALLMYDNPYVFCGMLLFVKLFSDTTLTTTWGACTDIGGRASASVFAFNNSVAGIGSICAPTMYGFIAEHYGWPTVFLTAAGAYILCSLSWLLVNCTIPVLAEDKP
ncbi:MAG: MFS transporter [Pirellulaceae bacterium]